MKDQIETLAVALVFLAFVAAAFVAGRQVGRMEIPDGCDTVTVVQRDTVHDTLTFVKPVPVEVRTVDTVWLHASDTVAVPLPIESKTYEGEDYRAVVSGWRPSIDEISVFPKTITVTTTNTVTQRIPSPRVSFGLAAGPGVLYDGKVHGGAGIVAGVLVRF
ncbi:MAG: hypothetical protein IKE76_09585 [Clostridia bacterium]|nr:hypothetical protein [Clostridia bacterium]